MKIVISSGHGAKISGAVGYIDEHKEAVRVVDQVAIYLRAAGVDVVTFEDKTSTDQQTNLETIVNFHNAQGPHDYDISVHFNSSNGNVSKAIGTEVWFQTQETLAAELATAMADAGHLIDRGAKYSSGLYFNSHCREKSVLLEVCFVNSKADSDLYLGNFNSICGAIAATLADVKLPRPRPPQAPQPPAMYLFSATGKCSQFGGPEDMGVDTDEPLAFIQSIEQKPELFLPYQPTGTSGLARRLNVWTHYLACRWDYDVTPREMLMSEVALVRSTKTGISLRAMPADWGPHESTGRIADLSPSLMLDLGIETDDEVEVTFPYRETLTA